MEMKALYEINNYGPLSCNTLFKDGRWDSLVTII